MMGLAWRSSISSPESCPRIEQASEDVLAPRELGVEARAQLDQGGHAPLHRSPRPWWVALMPDISLSRVDFCRRR